VVQAGCGNCWEVDFGFFSTLQFAQEVCNPIDCLNYEASKSIMSAVLLQVWFYGL